MSLFADVVMAVVVTSQSVYRPLFKLLQRDIRSRRRNVEVQSALVLVVMVRWCIYKLLRSMLVERFPLRIDSREFLAKHDFGCIDEEDCKFAGFNAWK